MRPYEPTKQQKGRGLAPSYHGHSPWSPCSCYELVAEWPSRWVECQTWCSREISSSGRLQAFVAEAKAGNPFAPVTVVPPNRLRRHRPPSGAGGRWRVAQRGLHGPRTLGRTAGSANHGVAAPTAAIRSSRDGCYSVAVGVVGQEPLGSVAAHSTLHQSLQAAHLPISHRDQTPMARQGC